MIFLYFGIPLAILVIAVIRAGKGKRSVIMLTIMVAIQVLFNSAAILNSMANGDDKSLNVGISMTLAQIVTYIAAIFITCKQANKVKKNLAIGYTQRLQEMRVQNMMTPKQTAEIIGIKKQQYLRYERGQEDIPIDTVFQLAKMYGVSTDYLLGKTNEKQQTNSDELIIKKTNPGSEQKN